MLIRFLRSIFHRFLLHIKEIADGPDFGGNYGDFLPPTGSDYTAIREFIKNKYPNGQIVDIEREGNGYTDVDIIDNRISKDVVFDASGNWVYTTYEVGWPSLPTAVLSAFNSSAYKGYYVDDIDFYETADNGNYYRFDLESPLGDIKIYITENGTVSIYGTANADSFEEFSVPWHPIAAERRAELLAPEEPADDGTADGDLTGGEPSDALRIILIIGIAVPALIIVFLLFKPVAGGKRGYDKRKTMRRQDPEGGGIDYDRTRSYESDRDRYDRGYRDYERERPRDYYDRAPRDDRDGYDRY